MTKVVEAIDGSVLVEVDDGNPSKRTVVDRGVLPYNDFESAMFRWQRIQNMLNDIYNTFCHSEHKEFRDQISELKVYAATNAKLNRKKLIKFYEKFVKEELCKHNK